MTSVLSITSFLNLSSLSCPHVSQSEVIRISMNSLLRGCFFFVITFLLVGYFFFLHVQYFFIKIPLTTYKGMGIHNTSKITRKNGIYTPNHPHVAYKCSISMQKCMRLAIYIVSREVFGSHQLSSNHG